MSIEGGICALLQVFDMPTSVRFYRDVLGFEVVQTSEREGDQFDWGLLRLNDAEVMLNTAYEQGHRPARPEAARVVAHGDTGLYFGCLDVDAVYRHLRDNIQYRIGRNSYFLEVGHTSADLVHTKCIFC